MYVLYQPYMVFLHNIIYKYNIEIGRTPSHSVAMPADGHLAHSMSCIAVLSCSLNSSMSFCLHSFELKFKLWVSWMAI